GTVPITLTLARIQAIGVRTTLVGEGSEAQTLRATAVVAPTEQGVAEVHVRSAGFVERVFVGQTQVAVSAGQPLFTYYSPEIFQAESELLALHDWRGPSDAANTMTGAAPADSARRKLELLGMSSRDIDQVVETRTPLRAVTISAPRAGYVMQKGLVAGSYLTPEMKLYEIQDLSQVYVVADVFQGDIGYLQKGTAGKFAPARRPEPSIDVKVDLVYPTLHAEARTTRVRMQVKSTKELLLRPGEFGTVEFATPAPKALTVPRDAVIDTGLATYVFVVQGEGVFSPREVVVRADHGDEVSVEAGLSSGERVVSGATFLIDSESRLQASAVEALAPAPSQSP
ncbi:MAG TPA: efflux RND transporter periplasmic adaptor subunit, partial [Polyangiaceae bacterium]|nr:efflux RND transporter periplasmic adaptor subunit [Polyangiaceae bacterium]